MLKLLTILFLGLSLSWTHAFAETSVAPNENRKQNLRAILLERLHRSSGEPVSIVIYAPMDSSRNHHGPAVAASVENMLRQYGATNISQSTYQLKNLTLEELRNAMVHGGADILINLLVKDSYFELYFYDKRTPYYIYAHTEVIPPQWQFQLSPQAVDQYSRLLLKRTLYRYLSKQYYELPRSESKAVLQSEIPRWVGSNESLLVINRELKSRFYLGVSFGSALSMGKSKLLWNSNVIGAQLGFRPYENFWVEGAFDSFSYNAWTGSLKYVMMSRETPLRLVPGLGFSMVSRQKVWNPDQTIGLGRTSYFLVPSFSALFPIGDVLLKAEAKVFFSLNLPKFMFMFTPGVLIPF